MTDELGVTLVRTLHLLVSELVANAVTYGGAGKGRVVELDLAIADEAVRATISDEGEGFVPGPAPPDPARHRQRGLQIVDSMADRFGVVSDSRTRVWFEIDRAGFGEAAASAANALRSA